MYGIFSPTISHSLQAKVSITTVLQMGYETTAYFHYAKFVAGRWITIWVLE